MSPLNQVRREHCEEVDRVYTRRITWHEGTSVYPQGSNNYRINFSGLGCWLTVIAIAWLLGAVGLGWIVKSIFVLVGLLIVTPVLAFIGFRWWLSRNLIEGACPVCDTPLTGLNQAQMVCPSCRTPLQVSREGFARFTPEGTVEVNAVDVTPGSDLADEAVEVTVEVLPPAEDER
ncbi:MAG: hypothetical protein AAGA01_11000 [Cyanobacteria bacterium P01_E01_bin.43]